ncbi:hypothetical protein F1728_27825 [Gimesia benthica]|uniref:Uncharacterized protein n=1 Tax=Gimesia benthica TaxID=2608982 RepID=A0A6I6AHS5_9PLAN|nr:hypothetical protein [Gimesia benthica]QGQ26254.1 hypothetical protein F1728_27825 [Gimesia benthica]
MDDNWDETDDDPTEYLPEVTDLMHRLLNSHRKSPDEADFQRFPGIPLEALDEAYRDLSTLGLMEYTDELVTIGDHQRRKLRLTREGL